MARLLLVASTLIRLLCWHKASQIEEQAEAHHQKLKSGFDAPGVRGSGVALLVINLSLMLIVVSCCLALIP